MKDSTNATGHRTGKVKSLLSRLECPIRHVQHSRPVLLTSKSSKLVSMVTLAYSDSKLCKGLFSFPVQKDGVPSDYMYIILLGKYSAMLSTMNFYYVRSTYCEERIESI